MRRLLIPTAFIGAAALNACTSISTTEYCVQTRNGNIVKEPMDVGINFTAFTAEECFSTTDQYYPSKGADTLVANSSDPVQVSAPVSVVYTFDRATLHSVYMAKRSHDAMEREIIQAINDGYRSAVSAWSVAQIFSSRGATIGDSVRAHIQAKLGTAVHVKQVYVGNVNVPESIRSARTAAAAQAQVLDKAEKQYVIDSVEARASVLKAQGQAESQRLLAQSYAAQPQVIALEIAKANASALASVCSGSQITTCIIGGSVVDAYRSPLTGGPR